MSFSFDGRGSASDSNRPGGDRPLWPPCYRCNLMKMSNVGANVWERNLGAFNLTDACAQ